MVHCHFFYVACNLSHGHNYYVPNLGVLRCAVQPVCSAVKNEVLPVIHYIVELLLIVFCMALSVSHINVEEFWPTLIACCFIFFFLG